MMCRTVRNVGEKWKRTEVGEVEGGGGGRTPSLVVEDSTEVVAVGEDVGLIWEIGAAGVDKVNAWKTWGAMSC